MRGIIEMIDLDRIVNLVARLTMIVANLIILVGMIQLAFWIPQEPGQTRAAKSLAVLHSNWRALIVVAVPLFYPAIRRFIEEVRQIGGVRLDRDGGEWEGVVRREDELYLTTGRRRWDSEAEDS